MKKIIVLVLTAIMMFSLCACVGGTSSASIDEQLFSGVKPGMSEEEALKAIGDGYSKGSEDGTSYIERKTVQIWGMNWDKQIYFSDGAVSMLWLYTMDDLSAKTAEQIQKLSDTAVNDMVKIYGDADDFVDDFDDGTEGYEYKWNMEDGSQISFCYNGEGSFMVFYMDTQY